MKKFIPIAIVGILVLSGLGAAAFTSNVSLKQASSNTRNISASVQFSSQPTLQEKDGFLNVEMNGATTQLLSRNKPVLPIYVKTYEIPFGSTNLQVTCTPSDIGSMEISAPITPARIAPLSELSEQIPYVMDESVYGSAALYPDSWYNSDLGAGRNDNGVEVTFVKVVCYPVRYSPLNNEVTYAGSFDVSITYDAPTTPAKTFGTHFDMVVIAPETFHAKLQSLIDEKNAKGVATMFKSMEDILAEYNGTDPPEQVKYFIKDAYDNWNITYVLLVGGLKSHLNAHDKDTRSAGYTDWWVPVRYVNIPMVDPGVGTDEGCLCDLYYGCLYNATGVFDSWDSNHDGVYAAWGASGAANDKFDMNPEVYVARLPCTTAREVTVVVNKIIKYESTGPAAKSWYKTFIGIAGKSFNYYQGKPDGEWLCDLAISYMENAIPDLKPVRCYSTNRDTGGLTPTPLDIILAMTVGAGFVDFEGHGNPLSWNTIWFDGTYPNDWTGGLNTFEFPLISNGNRLPVVVVGGCHNALYNITILGTLRDKTGEDFFCYGTPFPVCFCWGLVVKPRGGAIGSMGSTGYGFGGPDNPNALSAALEMNFFWEIGNNSVKHLSPAHGMAIQKYISENEITRDAAFCITNWALFGDPSLQFGGY
jgi:hypothetical protein